MRSLNWNDWMRPIRSLAEESGNKTLSMAAFAGQDNTCFEAERLDLYKNKPPSDEFLEWTYASEEYKIQNMPPL
jgi:predicted metallo-beta-lactamase superfamily hydrolase